MVEYLIDKEKVPFSDKNLAFAIEYGKFKTKEYLWKK